jgi:hypothetical protein
MLKYQLDNLVPIYCRNIRKIRLNFAFQRGTFETSNSTPIYSLREVAANYIELGLSVTPVKFKGKNPIIPGWQKLTIGKKNVDNWFGPEPTNIGVLLGTPSGGLVDIDLDDNDAVELATAFLPPTNMVFGRTSRPSSHRLYRVPDPGKPRKLAASGLGSIIELRSTGQQTVFPGSIHDSGEPITFEMDGEPAEVTWNGALSKSHLPPCCANDGKTAIAMTWL